MPVQATGAFAVVVNGALQVAQALRDAFATRTNTSVAHRAALSENNGSTTAQGLPWNGDVIADFYDLKANLGAAASAFQGIVFNGRDVLLIPGGNVLAATQNPAQTLLASYNTTLPFTASMSYQTVSVTTAANSAQAQGFGGGALDPNGFLYLVPFAGNYPSTSGLVVQFDTSKLLSDTTAYSTFDVTTLSAFGSSPTTGYFTGCCDGRWVYLCPAFSSTTLDGGAGGNSRVLTPHGWVVRYDTKTQVFGATSSWQAYNIAASISAAASGFLTSITDGKTVYFVPYTGTTLATFQIGQILATSTAWATVDLSTLAFPSTPQLTQFSGACLVGRYLFLVPFGGLANTGTRRSVVARLDTLDPRGITNSLSWQTFSLTTIAGLSTLGMGYQGALTDGIRLYLVPAGTGGASPTVSPFLAYDTRSDFTDPTAWLPMTGTTVTPTALKVGSNFAASDGAYGYLAPNWNLASTSTSGTFFRWRLWPGPTDAQVPQVGMSSQFWLDSSGKVGFGTRAPQEQVHAAANVRADGLLLGQLGTSGQVAQAPTTASVTTVGTPSGASAPFTLASYGLPPTALSAVNKGVRINAFGGFAGNGHTKYVLLNFGGTQILTSGVLAASGGSWFLEDTVLLSGTSPVTQVAGGMVVATPASGAATVTSAFVTATVATGSTITIALASSAVASTDVLLNGFSVDFIN